VGFFASSEAQDYNYTFGFEEIQQEAHRFTQIQVPVSFPDVVRLVRGLYGVDDVIQLLPFVMARNAILLANMPGVHGAADEEIAYQLDSSSIGKILRSSKDFETFYQKIRIAFVKFLVEQQYSSFNNRPYMAGNFVITAQSGDFKVARAIAQDDLLDNVLKNKVQKFQDDFVSLKQFTDHLSFKDITLTTQEYAELGTVFLFKNEQDLRDL